MEKDTEDIEKAFIEASVKAKKYSTVHPPIDYMDIGKLIGVNSTQGMELYAAVSQAYREYKEKEEL